MTDLISPTGRPGQATMVEQARAMAEVHAMIMMARDNPRSEQLAMTRMEDACGRLALAERAFYRFPRDGQQVSGATVQLARELARCWGNINFGIKELSRHDGYGQSEMMAEAWDIDTTARSFNVFIVPHKRDVGKSTKDLVQMREIYENNANAGARRLRECLFAVLPVWFREEAIDLCTKTLERGANKGEPEVPLVERKAWVIQNYADLRVTLAQLERKVGAPEGRWTAGNLAMLMVIGKSLAAGETQVDVEFPREQTHAVDVLNATVDSPGMPAATDTPAGQPPQETPPQQETAEAEAMATKGHIGTIHARLAKFDYPSGSEGQVQKLADLGTLIGRPITSTGTLTAHEANEVITQLNTCLEADQPNNALDAVLDAARQEQQR